MFVFSLRCIFSNRPCYVSLMLSIIICLCKLYLGTAIRDVQDSHRNIPNQWGYSAGKIRKEAERFSALNSYRSPFRSGIPTLKRVRREFPFLVPKDNILEIQLDGNVYRCFISLCEIKFLLDVLKHTI